MRRIICLLAMIISAASAQTFEVASIKPGASDMRGMRVSMRGGPGSKDPGLFTCENMSISNLISVGYNLGSYEYSGPDSADVRFMVSAKVPEGATHEEFLVMIQNLLVERFKLKFHREKKEVSGFELVVAKNGPKFKEHVTEPPTEDDPPVAGPFKKDEQGFPILPAGKKPMMIGANGFAIERFVEEPISKFAEMLSFRMRGPVVDATGLAGKYDFMLRWIEGTMPPDSPGVPIEIAIQEQLGLKVQGKKTTINLFVVDHVEKTPTEN